jgi:hypothetical protein
MTREEPIWRGDMDLAAISCGCNAGVRLSMAQQDDSMSTHTESIGLKLVYRPIRPLGPWFG